ncbi:NAD(P)H-hydrate dehydratase [Paracidobacterium acidisoli]|uniref:Bifunctional NAD(P)H-hydrate repair enzyme n=1 Tax=Paracidobacterium acidisoli TaxID=2303751 RepID=A0A372IKQ8_9BACT|nr:NAD(P)H-hydrate dehydratase [Paracidobacterium acidisoli]MBT9332926.1 NAD(P)H-hydrate dehydratase [Paracidobacterium acidisoli]
MNVLTAAEMRATDRATAETYGVPSFDLMRHAGHAVARFVEREYAGARKITVLCGRGNNGGDGCVAARALKEAGREVRVLLLGDPADLKGDAKSAYDEMGIVPVVVADGATIDSPVIARLLAEADLIVDAVVGTGFQPPLRGTAAVLRDRVNVLQMPVAAVDLPSGWDADSREFSAEGAFRADAVVTFTAPKTAHVCGNLTGSAYGPIVVAPIGSPEEAIASSLTQNGAQERPRLRWAGAAKRIAEAPRTADANKGLYGHALIVAGAWGKSGAAAMASLAALRTGAGLVTAAIPESILPMVAGVAPELMTIPLKQGAKGEIDRANLEPEAFEVLTKRRTVIAVGPGIGEEPSTEEFLLGLIEKTDVPLVIDADALNLLAKHPETMKKLSGSSGRRRTVVMTPHPGEMARLAGISTKEVQTNREPLAREFAQRHQITLVLKGWRTLIAHPGGEMAVNTTGNPGMAKGGSGDILTGIVAAMLAQHADRPAEAVEAAVYLHGLAADFAVREQDEHTLLATDTIGHLFRAFHFRAYDSAGYVWIEGLPGRGAGKR